MNKEEILEKSREENKNRDLAETEALRTGSRVAWIAGCLLCMVICAAQWALTKTVNWGCWAANFGTLGTVFLVKYIKLRRRNDLLMTILDLAWFVFFLIGFVMSLRG